MNKINSSTEKAQQSQDKKRTKTLNNLDFRKLQFLHIVMATNTLIDIFD